MTIKFMHSNGTSCGFLTLSIKTDDKVDIDFVMDKGEVIEFSIDGVDLDPIWVWDCNNGVYVKIDGEFKTLRYLCLQAEKEYNNEFITSDPDHAFEVAREEKLLEGK